MVYLGSGLVQQYQPSVMSQDCIGKGQQLLLSQGQVIGLRVETEHFLFISGWVIDQSWPMVDFLLNHISIGCVLRRILVGVNLAVSVECRIIQCLFKLLVCVLGLGIKICSYGVLGENEWLL